MPTSNSVLVVCQALAKSDAQASREWHRPVPFKAICGPGGVLSGIRHGRRCRWITIDIHDILHDSGSIKSPHRLEVILEGRARHANQTMPAGLLGLEAGDARTGARPLQPL